MTEKSKESFNLSKKEVYKYRKVYKGRIKNSINHLEILNSLYIKNKHLNGKIDEFYVNITKLTSGLVVHNYQFTINDNII